MQTKATVGKRYRGFSLVELLLTLTAMMIVASVVWKAGSAAITYSNNCATSVEMAQLDKALNEFQMRFGDYPPDFHDYVGTIKFLKRIFPNCPREKYPPLAAYGPTSALYFWLAGPDGRGFSTNPANPFDDGKMRIGPFFKFKPEQLKSVEGIVEFYPPKGIKGSPYVYFRGGSKGYDGHPGWPPARPYRSSKDGKWIEPNRYQILCPGHDGKFGQGTSFPAGADYDAGNFDDMTSFSQGDTLGSAKPKNAVDVEKSNNNKQ